MILPPPPWNLPPTPSPFPRPTHPPLQSALAKERKELKDQQQRTLLDAIPKDLSRPWEDPMADPSERALAQELRGIG